MRSSMTRPIPLGSVITRSWRCGTAAGALQKTPIISRSTCSMALLLAFKACGSLLSTAPPCSPAAPLTPLPLTSPLPAWAIPTVWFQLVFVRVRLPAGRDEFLISVDSPATGGVTLTQVHGWKFHVDFGTPSNSTLGLGVNHTPNANVP